MGWYYVFCGGLLEIGFTTCMRYTDGFRNVPWTLGFLVCIAASSSSYRKNHSVHPEPVEGRPSGFPDCIRPQNER